ncbi:MAG: signal peptidase II, partial [Anaerolineae bacterium]
TNKGASFGLFPELSWLYTLVAMVVIAVILLFYRRFPTDHWLVMLSLGLQLGGAFGNLVDRLWRGQVVDFIDLNFWPLQEWPVFNVADSSIVVGVCILAAYLFFFAQDLA